MNIASLSENNEVEKRLAITPEITKKYLDLGFNLFLPNNYGNHLGFDDNDYKSLGVNFLDNEKVSTIFNSTGKVKNIVSGDTKVLGKLQIGNEDIINENYFPTNHLISKLCVADNSFIFFPFSLTLSFVVIEIGPSDE